MTVEKLLPQYVDSEVFRAEYEPMYRYNSRQGRLYYRKTEDGRIYYVSVTTAIRNAMPTSPFLIKWIAQHGEERAAELMNKAADYGTMMHVFCGMFLIKGRYNFNNLSEDIAKYILESKDTKYHSHLLDSESQLQRDLLAFMQFVHDYELKPILVEPILYSDKIGLAGAIDIVCEMNASLYTDKTPKEKRRRVLAIGDMKSGQHGFWDSYIIQLGIYRQIWNERYPDYEIQSIFNWSPKDWRKDTPTYNYANHDGKPILDLIPHYVEIAKATSNARPSMRMIVDGTVRVGESPVGKIRFTDDLTDLENK